MQWILVTVSGLLFLQSALAYLRARAAAAPDYLGPTVDNPYASNLNERPPPLATFRGRLDELDLLTNQFHEGRRGEQSHGAVILPIHGMPGVGKSALAHELARRLANYFPDGMLYANLGNAGSIRAEADILNRFLRALGVPTEEMPTETNDRAAMFRSATATKAVLVILDAARDHEQVARLLPTGQWCAVIVTSRRDLGPALTVPSTFLDVPDTDVALDILRGVSNTRFGEEEKYAIEIIRQLGRLPLAIRAAGDAVVQGRKTLAAVAHDLREPALRDEILSGHGRGVEERIETEFLRLTETEKVAFLALSLVDAPSFVPWVLLPLLGLEANEYTETEKLISRLAERQLLERVGRDATGLDRYRFHPIVRIFAEHFRDEHGKNLPDNALDNLAEAFLEAIDLVLAENDPEYAVERTPTNKLRWYPMDSPITQIVKLSDRWARTEHVNLRRCVSAAARAEKWALCWRIAARLGDSVPGRFDRVAVRDALDQGRRAAQCSGSYRGETEVLLATGGWLSRIGEFGSAFDAFEEASLIANRLRDARSVGSRLVAFRLESESYRRLAEAHLRLGAYRDASRELSSALELAHLAKVDRQIELVQLMQYHLDDFKTLELTPPPRSDDELTFWYEVAMVEQERRNNDYEAAAERLRHLRHAVDDDGSRTATVLGRIAEVRLDELRAGRATNEAHVTKRALHRASEATNRFQMVRDMAGIVRARCVLTRALAALGLTVDAQEQLDKAMQGFQSLSPLLRHDNSPIRAAILRAEGELHLAAGRFEQAERSFAAAAGLFRAHGDRLSERITMLAVEPSTVVEHIAGKVSRRDPVVWLDGVSKPLHVGQAFDVCYSVPAPNLTDGGVPAASRYLTVVLDAENCTVDRTAQTVRLDAWAPLEPVVFHVTPMRASNVHLSLRVYEARAGALQQQFDLPVRHVAGQIAGAAA